MTESPRNWVPNEVSPDELVRDDGTLDARKVNSGRPEIIDAEACADCRNQYLHGCVLESIAAQYDATREAIRQHVRGECDHDHDVEPIEADT
jgi:hypothetical protein